MKRRTLFTILVPLLVVLVLAAGGVWWLTGRGRAIRSGTIQFSALSAPVTVRWDAYAVPHLKGERGVDLAAALGWLHANDRMVQMELGRRNAAGTLAELLGERLVAVDAEARTMRYRQGAEKLWESASPETRRWLVAYSAGVNARWAGRPHDLPPTLTALRDDLASWTPVDSLSMVMLMARDLSFWQGRPEEQRFDWLRRFGVERALELVGDPGIHVPAAIAELATAGAAAPTGGGGGASAGAAAGPLGSNNWALGLSRSSAGFPIVANDPHLRLRLPGVWFQVHMRAPDYEVAGMTLPGLPGVVIGRNGDLAWALTNVMLDDHDLFFEETDAEGARVRRGDGWAPIEREVQEVRVKGGDAVRVELLFTDRGPLLPAEPALGLPARTIRWTAWEGGDPLSAFVHLARSRRVDEVRAGIGGYAAPAQNLVVADRDGGLLYTLLGRLPVRRTGDGRLPSPGWDPAYGWEGLAPAESNPEILRPEDDLLVTANQDLHLPDPEVPFSGDYDLPARAARIRQLLEGRRRWTPRLLSTVQADVVSLYARAEVAAVAGSYEGDAGRAWKLLERWDGRMNAVPAAALFAVLDRRLQEAVLGDEIDPRMISNLARRNFLSRLLAGEASAAWWDDARTPEVEDRTTIVARELEGAWEECSMHFGQNPERWVYTDLHWLELRHPFGEIPVIGGLANRGPFAVAGSATTVNALGGGWEHGRERVYYGPSMRWVTVVGALDETYAVLPGGQAGHPFDPHYDDQLELYLQDHLRPVAWTEEAIREATVSVLRLEP